MISESLYFTYDGVDFYSEFGIINVHIESGMYQETFLSTRNIIEQETRYRTSPYFIQTKEAPLQIKVSFAFKDGFDRDMLRSVARALKKDYYCPLVFSEDPTKIYYALCVDEANLIHNGIQQGYLTLNFRCNSPYAFSPVYSTPIYDLSSNVAGGTNIALVNQGDINMYAVITCQVINGGSFSIVNNSDGGKKLSFTTISNSETLTINTENEDITTDASSTYRYGNMSSDSVFLSFPRGTNNLTIFGNVKIKFTYELRFLV